MRFGPPVRFACRPDRHNLAYQVLGDAELDPVFLLGYQNHLGLLWEEASVARFLHRLASSRSPTAAGVGSGVSLTPGSCMRSSSPSASRQPLSRWSISASGRPDLGGLLRFEVAVV
jgi:hypothetical protein